jgi:hypothetical protein
MPKNNFYQNILLITLSLKKNKTKNYFFKKKKRKKNKRKINPCGWPKLQISHCAIKNNSNVFKVGKK